MPAYFVIDLTVFDTEKMKMFEEKAGKMVAKYGGRFLTRGETYDVMEGDWRPQHLLIEEYPSRQAILEMFNDPENEPLKAMRRAGSVACALAVDGFEG